MNNRSKFNLQISMKLDSDDIQTGGATYCPEDDKLRLYVGRVPREEYLALKAEGWASTPKQSCDFVAVWTPDRYQTALAYGDGSVDDEDMSPEDRAADRAERFGGYREKRLGEAVAHADRYDASPKAFGHQDKGRAARAADRVDRIAGRACDAWSKAEYWQRRTAGVIEHALYKSTPGVRMGRIKTLEAELRKRRASLESWRLTWQMWDKARSLGDALTRKQAEDLANYHGGHSYDWMHPRPEAVTNEHVKKSGTSLWSLLVPSNGKEEEAITPAEMVNLWFGRYPNEPGKESEWTRHLELRLAYENQMMEAQGGRAGELEMEVGGFLRGGRRGGTEERRILKVNKSTVTGRVVSVVVRDNHPSDRNHWGNPWPDGVPRVLEHLVEVERLSPDAYRPATDEERAAFEAEVAAQKKAAKEKSKAKKSAGEDCPLINPTDEDAQRMQDAINEKRADQKRVFSSSDRLPVEVKRFTQAEYSAYSKGTYSRLETRVICETGLFHRTRNFSNITRHSLFKLRFFNDSVIIISDKPQKPIPWQRISDARAKCPTLEKFISSGDFAKLVKLIAGGGRYMRPSNDCEESRLVSDGEYVGLLNCGTCFPAWTDKGRKYYAEHCAAEREAAEAAKADSEAFKLEAEPEQPKEAPQPAQLALF